MGHKSYSCLPLRPISDQLRSSLLHRVPKKEDTKLMAVTPSFLNRFSKFFHSFTDILSGKFPAQ